MSGLVKPLLNQPLKQINKYEMSDLVKPLFDTNPCWVLMSDLVKPLFDTNQHIEYELSDLVKPLSVQLLVLCYFVSKTNGFGQRPNAEQVRVETQDLTEHF